MCDPCKVGCGSLPVPGEKWHISERRAVGPEAPTHRPCAPPCVWRPVSLQTRSSDSDLETRFASQPLPLRIIVSFPLHHSFQSRREQGRNPDGEREALTVGAEFKGHPKLSLQDNISVQYLKNRNQGKRFHIEPNVKTGQRQHHRGPCDRAPSPPPSPATESNATSGPRGTSRLTRGALQTPLPTVTRKATVTSLPPAATHWLHPSRSRSPVPTAPRPQQQPRACCSHELQPELVSLSASVASCFRTVATVTLRIRHRP